MGANIPKLENGHMKLARNTSMEHAYILDFFYEETHPFSDPKITVAYTTIQLE